MTIVNDIKSPQELFWHRRSKKKDPFPVRICEKSEHVFVQSLSPEWDDSKKALVQFLGEFQEQNKRDLVPRNQLTPYTGNTASSHDAWCVDTTKQYMKALEKKKGKNKLSPVQLRMEQLYLEILLERVVQNQQARELRQQEEAKKELEELLASEHDNTALQPKKPRKPRRIASEFGVCDNNERLRAGDVIEYTHPQYVQGHRQGYTVSEILSIQKQEYPLILKSGDFLPKEHWIRRIQRVVRGKLVEYNGNIRAIDGHSLQYDKKEIDVTAGIVEEAKRYGAIIEQNVQKFQPALEEAGVPMDLLQNVGGTKKRTLGKENVQETVENENDQKMPAVDDDDDDSAGGKRKADAEDTSEGDKKRAKRVSRPRKSH